MNRIKVAVCISVLAALVCTAGYFVVHAVAKETLCRIDAAQQAAEQEDYPLAARLSQEVAEYYDARIGWLALFTRREQLAAIDVSLHGLRAYAGADNASDFQTELDKARAQLRMMVSLFTGPF